MNQLPNMFQRTNFRFLLIFLLSGFYFHAQSATPEKGPHLSASISPNFAPSGLLCGLLSHPELSLITNLTPDFSWIVVSDQPGDFQTTYQIMVASSIDLLKNETPDLWNSGNVLSSQSTNINYEGKPLSSNSSYYWKVKTTNKLGGESAWSGVQKFNTSDLNAARKWPGESKWIQITDDNGVKFWSFENRHPVIYHPVKPVKQTVKNNGVQFFDFGKSTFATLALNLTWNPKNEEGEKTIKIHIGEKAVGDSIDQKPGGGVIFRTYPLTIKSGTHLYSLEIPRFVARYPHSQVMPLEMPEVAPFRFCELISDGENIQVNEITQKALYYLFNDQASGFSCSDERLNSIYNLCKHSIIANTYNGDYANSERERMMYEADCYIQQMGHYAIDREFAIARYSLENLIYHATWPTEWISHSIFMAWADYWHTGNTEVISTYFDDLKAKTLIALETENGLISTRTGLQTTDFLESIHFNGKALRDIVDWPHGGMGIGAGGETDNYDFLDFNTVVNAFYYQSLVYMSEMSKAIGKQSDAAFFSKKAAAVKTAFNRHFFDEERGFYMDGIGSAHASLHANMYPLCFGLVPEKNQASVIDYIKSKGMACGVYGANYLLEALLNYDQTDYALSLLTADSDRSWMNMIRLGATMTTEAWDNKYKSNNGWSHAWSASPVHIIPRKIMGIEPAEAGFGKMVIKPRPGSLSHAEVKLPTIRGDVQMSFKNKPQQSFSMNLTIPANTTADVYLPFWSKSQKITMNGKAVKYHTEGNFAVVEGVGSGNTSFETTR